MKKVIFILLAVAMTTLAHAQTFQNGTTNINAGIGLGTGLNGLGNARPAISVSLDRWTLQYIIKDILIIRNFFE